ncbi:MAG: DUF6291 domain-containing protein [Clostridia bacterium]|nr:DUF6291 domain-containing protein [Clostridia bacterium]
MKKYLKFRESYANYIKGMTDKQAGQFIKAISGYAFEGKTFESKDAKVMAAYVYAKTQIDISRQNSYNGKKGYLVMSENKKHYRSEKMDDLGALIGAIAITAAANAESVDSKKSK